MLHTSRIAFSVRQKIKLEAARKVYTLPPVESYAELPVFACKCIEPSDVLQHEIITPSVSKISN